MGVGGRGRRGRVLCSWLLLPHTHAAPGSSGTRVLGTAGVLCRGWRGVLYRVKPVHLSAALFGSRVFTGGVR